MIDVTDITHGITYLPPVSYCSELPFGVAKWTCIAVLSMNRVFTFDGLHWVSFNSTGDTDLCIAPKSNPEPEPEQYFEV